MVDENKVICSDEMEYYGFGIKVMKQLKVCSYCGVMTNALNRFCKECGKPLPNDTLYQFYKKRHKCCSVCETVVCDAALYCPQCGIKIEEKEDGI